MNKEKDIKSLLVNPDTGAVTGEIYEGDYIIREKTAEYIQNTVEIGKKEKFIKLFDSTIAALGDESLTGNEWKILTTFLQNFRYDSGLVSFANGNPLYTEDICRLSNIPPRTVFRGMDKLILKKIIAKNKTGQETKYYMNPFIFCKGTRVNKTLYTMFENSRWRQLHTAGIRVEG